MPHSSSNSISPFVHIEEPPPNGFWVEAAATVAFCCIVCLQNASGCGVSVLWSASQWLARWKPIQAQVESGISFTKWRPLKSVALAEYICLRLALPTPRNNIRKEARQSLKQALRRLYRNSVNVFSGRSSTQQRKQYHRSSAEITLASKSLSRSHITYSVPYYTRLTSPTLCRRDVTQNTFRLHRSILARIEECDVFFGCRHNMSSGQHQQS